MSAEAEMSRSLRLEVGRLNDVTFSAVTRLVAKYPPFLAYSFGLMVVKLQEQLGHGSNVMVIRDNKLVAYTGWIVVDDRNAGIWLAHGGELPEPKWDSGNACIVTVTVSENRAYLMPMLRALSHVCAGKKVYRMRSFKDGREDMRRPPIEGRKQDFSAGARQGTKGITSAG